MSRRNGVTPFGLIVAMFPTRAVAGSAAIQLLWRILFYTLRPKKPFRFATPNYTLWAIPDRRSLTRAVIRRGTWEQLETRIVVALLRAGGDFVDVGANFGHYAMVASNILGEQGRVFAFEPSPAPYAELLANIVLQPHSNIHAYQVALSDTSGTAEFFIDGANPGGHSLGGENLRQFHGSFNVATATLDSFLSQHSDPARRIGLVKSDCQGADAKVLRGARGVLSRHRPWLMTEFWPQGMRVCGESPCAFVDMIGELEYLPYFLSPWRGAMVAITPDALQGYPAPGEPDYLDLLLVPTERLDMARRLLGSLLVPDDGGPRF